MKKFIPIFLFLLGAHLALSQTGDINLDSIMYHPPVNGTARNQADWLEQVLFLLMIDGNLGFETYPEQLDSIYQCCLLNKTGDVLYEKTIEAKILLYKGCAVTFDDPQAAQPFLYQSIQYFAAIRDTTWEAIAYEAMTFVASNLGDSTSFAQYHDLADALSPHVQNPYIRAVIQCDIGIGCYDFGRFAEAAEHYFNALALVEKYKTVPLLKLEHDIYHNLDGVYSRLGDVKNGLIYIKKAIQVAESLNQSTTEHYLAMCIDDQLLNDYPAALQAIMTAEKRKPPDALNITNAMIEYGYANCYRHLGNIREALVHAKKGVELLPISINATFGAVALEALANCEYADHQINIALEHTLTAYESFLKSKNNGGLVRTSDLLTRIYESLGNYEKALEYSELNYQYQHQIERQQSTRQLAFGEFNRDSAIQKAKRDAEVQAKLNQQRNIRYALYASLFILALLAFLLYNRFRLKKRSADELKLKNIEVETARRHAEKERKRAEISEAFKSRFLANMSHEIRTPLHGISGFTDLLLETSISEKQRRWLTSIHQSTFILNEVVNDILDLSKLEAGEVHLRNIPFSPGNIANDIQNTLMVRANKKGISLQIVLSDRLPKIVMGDPTRLYQILINLAGNAVKFTEKGGVTLSLDSFHSPHPQKVSIKFSVIDTGIGIPEEKLALVFESYQQAGDDTADRFGGTGLGLTIARDLVNLYHSEIEIKSKIGKGTTFSFVIEFFIPDAHTELIQSSENDLYYNDSIRVLLTDDNAFNLEIASEVIYQYFQNAKVITAGNGKEALEKLRECDVDIVLMDMQMPEMTGMQATQYIRENFIGSKRDVPIIALTASATPEEIEKALLSGMNKHLGKPFKSAELARIIADTLHLRHADDKSKSSDKKEFISSETNMQTSFNLQFLRDFCNGDEQQVQYYLQKFKTQYPIEMDRLVSCLNARDKNGIYMTAHTLKPQFAFVGLKQASELVAELEKSALNGDDMITLFGLVEKLKEMTEVIG